LEASIRAISDIGIVREENQDSHVVHEPSDSEVRARRGSLVAIADGMGGLDDGSTASRIAIETVLRAYYAHPGEAKEALEDAVKDANRAIFDHARGLEGRRLMGSTLTALAVLPDRAVIAHVGDSRCYRYRGGSLEQVTRDHSLVRELADRGEIDESSARYTFHRNVLTRGLGLREEVTPDIHEILDLGEGDTFLLSSDGLHEQVEPDEMVSCIDSSEEDLDSGCRQLVKIARERGGPDNITVALVRIGKDGEPPPVRRGAAIAGTGAGARAPWLLPVAVFGSFAAGVLLALVVGTKPPLEEETLRALRSEVEEALGTPAAKDAEAEAERLEGHLKEIRRILDEKR
jgi:protein phosphatase